MIHTVKSILSFTRVYEQSQLPRSQLKSNIYSFLKLQKDSQIEVGEYFEFRLWRDSLSHEEKAQFSGWRRHIRALVALNPLPYRACTEDKLLFATICQAAGLAQPRLLGIVDHSSSLKTRHRNVRSVGELIVLLQEAGISTVIAKPTSGTRGQSITRLHYDGNLVRTQDNIEVDDKVFSELFHYNYRGVDAGTFMLQEWVAPSEATLRYSPDCPFSYRVITLMDQSAQITPLFTYMKVPEAGHITDNLSAGGYACPIDEQGKILGFRSGEDRSILETELPNGLDLTFTPPMLEQTTQLALKLAEAFAPNRCVAWDIACGANGPMVLEGNNPFNKNIQTVFDRGIWNAKFRDTTLYAESSQAGEFPWWPKLS